MKVAVSVPDAVFEAAERVAKRERRSRSQVYADALREYVKERDPRWITEQLNAVYDKVDSRMDPAFLAAAVEVIRRDPW